MLGFGTPVGGYSVMSLKTPHILALVALFMVVGTALHAGDAPTPNKGKGKTKPGAGGNKDGLEFIIDHAKDLELTSTQEKQLEDLNTKVTQEREKLKEDPEMRELFKAQYEAQQSGDQDAIRTARKNIRVAMDKKGGLKVENVVVEVARILNTTQLKKLADLRNAAGMDPNPVKTAREQNKQETADANRSRPDVNKGAPNLYDNEK